MGERRTLAIELVYEDAVTVAEGEPQMSTTAETPTAPESLMSKEEFDVMLYFAKSVTMFAAPMSKPHRQEIALHLRKLADMIEAIEPRTSEKLN